MSEFVHLHCHTQYSLLDGAARISNLLGATQEMGMPAIAITDHGNLFGVPEFYTQARRAGIQPIVGCEFYVTPSGMSDRSDRTRYHQVLLAKNLEGYRNLIRLSSLSYTEGHYYKPRLDLDTIRRHSEGLIATTCCLQGQVLQTILHGTEEQARAVFEQYLEIFGDDYYIEIQDHGIGDQRRCNAVLTKWAKEYGVKVVATNDVHYVAQGDAAAQDVLLCLQTGKDLADPNRMRFENDQFYLKTPAEMTDALGAHLDKQMLPGALATTLEVADKCSLDIPMGELLMPHFPIPESFGDDMDAYLRELTLAGARNRYGELTQEIMERIDTELSIIAEMGYAGYFLIVQDLTTAARKLDVRVGPGRGSAAGSLVAYALGVTNIDPLRYGLLFERFLNPERVSMPDIDIDFDDRGRSRVIDYVVQKYGRESVCQIITFGTMGARSVIRDVSRVLGIPLDEADRIAKLVPDGVKVSLDQAIREVPDLKKLTKSPDQQIRRLMHYAHVLEGSARHTGVHAAGVIIAPGRVSDYVPVSLAKSKAVGEVITTQYDGKWVEEFGLLKMDFLGLKTLTVLNDALDLVKQVHGVEIDLDEIPLDCEKTFALFQRAETVAIFQFESEGMREWLRKLKPTSIDDLIAMNALYRPGPMDLIPNYVDRKHGRESVSFPHEMLKPILEATYGIPVYQEQVMQIAQVMGGYTLGAADLLRRAMGKKKQSEMDKQRAIFVEGAQANNVDPKTANEVFDMMAKFAGYGFNKSHSAAYSVVAYQTAYLKAHYPAIFLAAAMTNEMGDTKKLSVVLDEAHRMGIHLLPPSINRSAARFTVETDDDGQDAVRFGLGGIKGVGLGAIDAIVEAREQLGSFRSIYQLTENVDLRAVNKKALECLARVGALDELGGHRSQLVEAVDGSVQYGQRRQADAAAGQNSLFGTADAPTGFVEPALPTVAPWSKAQVLKEERELIGVYVSGHPLEAFKAEARAFASMELGKIREEDVPPVPEGRFGGADPRPAFSFCGIVTDIQRRTTRTGKPIAFAQLEDFTGTAELVCFSGVLDRIQTYLVVDEIVLAKGIPEFRGGNLKVIVQDILPMWKVRDQLVKSIVLRVTDDKMGEDVITELQALCDANRGQCKLYFDISLPDAPGPQRIHSRKYVVDPNAELLKGVTRLFGRDNVVLEGETS